MNIAIIDDEKPARSELMYLINEVCNDILFTEYKNGEEALDGCLNNKFDLICIDLNLGDISGLTLASSIRALQPKAEIVFATAYNNYAENAFNLDALYYLLKPFSKEKVAKMIEKYNKKHGILPRIHKMNKVTKLSICIDKKYIMVHVDKIVYIEAQNKYCVIHTKQGDYQDNNTLSYFEEKLKDSGFLRIQKSYLINLNDVAEIYPWFNNTYCVKMEGFKEISLPVSRNKIKELKHLLCI